MFKSKKWKRIKSMIHNAVLMMITSLSILYLMLAASGSAADWWNPAVVGLLCMAWIGAFCYINRECLF